MNNNGLSTVTKNLGRKVDLDTLRQLESQRIIDISDINLNNGIQTYINQIRDRLQNAAVLMIILDCNIQESEILLREISHNDRYKNTNVIIIDDKRSKKMQEFSMLHRGVQICTRSVLKKILSPMRDSLLQRYLNSINIDAMSVYPTLNPNHTAMIDIESGKIIHYPNERSERAFGYYFKVNGANIVDSVVYLGCDKKIYKVEIGDSALSPWGVEHFHNLAIMNDTKIENIRFVSLKDITSMKDTLVMRLIPLNNPNPVGLLELKIGDSMENWDIDLVKFCCTSKNMENLFSKEIKQLVLELILKLSNGNPDKLDKIPSNIIPEIKILGHHYTVTLQIFALDHQEELKLYDIIGKLSYGFVINFVNIDKQIAAQKREIIISLERINDLLRMASSENLTHQISAIKSIARAVDAKDGVSGGHSNRMAKYCRELAKMLNICAINNSGIELDIGIIALGHDAGKIGTPDEILTKPGRLTDEEMKVIKRHPTEATRILLSEVGACSPSFEEFEKDGIKYIKGDLIDLVAIGAEQHHEKINGRGYPNELHDGNQHFCILSKIIAVVDVFDAVTSPDRPYKKPWTLNKALEFLCSEGGSAFDEVVVHTFIEMIKKFVREEKIKLNNEGIIISCDLGEDYI